MMEDNGYMDVQDDATFDLTEWINELEPVKHETDGNVGMEEMMMQAIPSENLTQPDEVSLNIEEKFLQDVATKPDSISRIPQNIVQVDRLQHHSSAAVTFNSGLTQRTAMHSTFVPYAQQEMQRNHLSQQVQQPHQHNQLRQQLLHQGYQSQNQNSLLQSNLRCNNQKQQNHNTVASYQQPVGLLNYNAVQEPQQMVGPQSRHQRLQRSVITSAQRKSQQTSQATHLHQIPGTRSPSLSLEEGMQERIQPLDTLVRPLNVSVSDQQMSLNRSQRMSPVASTASVSTQAGSACLASWHDHAYQQIQLLRDMYLSDVVKLYKRANELCLQLTNAETATKYQKTRIFVEKIYKFLQISRTDMIQMPEDKVCSYMNTVTSYLDSVRSKNSALVQQQQQEQLLMLPGSQSKTLMPPHRSMNFQFTSLPQGLTFSHVDSSHLTPPQGFTRLLAASTINSLQSGPLPGRETRNALRQLQGSSSSSKYSINRPEWIRNSKTGQEQRNASPLCHHSAKSAQRSTLTVPEQSTLLVPEQTNSSPRTNLNSSDSTTSSVSSSSTSFPSQRHMLQVEKLKLPMQQPLIEPNRQQIQHHSTGQHTEYSPRSLLPSNLYQLHASSQTSQLSSPQVDMRNLLPPPSKTGTPLHSTSSPFLLSCPSTPLTPSSVPVDSEKLLLQKIPTFIAENPQHQERPVMSVDFQSRLTTENQTTVIDTHVTSTSPLPVEVTSSEGSQQLDSLGRAHKRLVEAVKALSTEALSSALHDMSAVICMTDRTAETSLSASRGAIGLDLVDEFNCNCQESLLQLGSPSAEIMRRHMNSMPSDASISPLGENENFQILSTWATYSQSAAALTIKRPRIESSRVLLEEINEINQKLVETMLDVVSDPFKDADRIGAGQGTIVRCSYRAVAFGETFKQQFASSGMNLLLRLLVPMDYPDSSPVILDEFSGGWSENSEDLTEKVKMNFSLSLRKLSQPMLLEEIARTWDTCARAVLTEVAEQRGGVAFTSRYGTWETCIITPCSS